MADATLAGALAALQTQLPHVGKGKTARVVTKDKGAYSYSYADLAAVSRELLPIMGKLGLAFTCRPSITEAGAFVLDYMLMHEGGETIAGAYPLPATGSPQQIGSAITYARRYCLCAVTGLATDDDDDDGAEAEKAKPAKRVRTAHSDPEHQRLQPRRTPDDRPAQRGPAPPEEDLWAGQPAGEFKAQETSLPDRRAKPHTPAQMIAAHWRRLGITDDEERHNWTARMAGVDELTSTTDLPPDRQRTILTVLAQCKDIGKVQEWIDEQAGVPS